MQELEQALAQHAPPPPTEDPSLHELPPLVLDGIPTPVDKMTQVRFVGEILRKSWVILVCCEVFHFSLIQ